MSSIHRSIIAILLGVGPVVGDIASAQLVRGEPTKAKLTPEDLVAETTGAWSKTINGLRGRLVLRRSEVIVGTPRVAVLLELENMSDLATPKLVDWESGQMEYGVEDATGKPLRTVGSITYSGGIGASYELILPMGGRLRFPVSMGGAGIDGGKAAMIDVGPACVWHVPGDGKVYRLKGTFGIGNDDSKPHRWHGVMELPPAEIPMRTPALDPAALGKLIDELGQAMIDQPHRTAGHRAARSLSLVDDPRVVPWYVKAMETGSSSLMMGSLDRLSRFNSDAALAGIRRGMTVRSGQIGQSSVPSQGADAVRYSAALALARSKHPKALGFLQSMRHDSYRPVRLAVAHRMARAKTADARRVLESMRHDRDQAVRDEVDRLLKGLDD
jgi:hypothetical protein